MMKNINFVSQFKKANIASVIIFILSIFFISFKGLNYGIDFKNQIFSSKPFHGNS